MKPTDRPAHGDRPEDHHYTPEELHNDDVAHEESDVDVRAIAYFAAGLVVVAVVSAALTVGLFVIFERQAAANDPQVSPLAVPPTVMPARTSGSPYFGGAPQPQLVTNEPAVLRQLRQDEERQLHDYGWVDEKTGVARIPIDEAKKLILERGLPARAGTPDPTRGTHAPAYGESSGGRTIPKGSSAAAPRAPSPPAPPKTPGAS